MATPDLTQLSKAVQPSAGVEETERTPGTETHDDGAGRAIMFGRYVGQITARIERAWLKPRTALDGGAFTCQVQIRQDEIGRVQDIALRNCNGDTRWQGSLIRAIQSASPLPAPPEPTVFRRMLTLELGSGSFLPGGSEDGFEPPRDVAALTREPVQAPTLTSDVLDQLRAIRDGRPVSVDLRIHGPRSPDAAAETPK